MQRRHTKLMLVGAAFLGVSLSAEALVELLHPVTNGPHAISEDLAEVVTTRLSMLPGVIDTRTMIAFKAYSKHDLEAMWSLGTD